MSSSRRSLFRPCIDLHNGQVKQIVGGTLSDKAPGTLRTNFVARQSAAEFAQIYKKHDLEGGHVIKLGPGNDEAALQALAAWPDKLQVGGGINDKNAQYWIDSGASKVIVTSYLFPDAKFSLERLKAISDTVGKERLVVDVSCRRREDKWLVAMNKWQDITDMESLDILSEYCSEFLVHAADVEGLCKGIDEELVKKLGEWVTVPTTYAGGAKEISDLDLVTRLSEGRVDLTYGSALDMFGGTQVKFDDLVKDNTLRKAENTLNSFP
ncbi:Phosphoribosylformimino-5-aminoimidazole carboxamide ribotide isomerase [Pholiota conissans]|uniref:1-(5-phosphoribosyl)-5-[(5-phosphoribosylamino)methylideneamino] imidazole-4-carboxamide isomerase n=1 Tax=Pholiota conissans TaxID=109636 RepID=A0A9P5ZC54_9AGAR|nr:Phosphoribosylformimino-5-aminoimidazole carboxamide ribotide isomerase [Pholiota conissans]